MINAIRVWSRDKKYAHFLGTMRPSPSDRVLVLGCGDGSYFCARYPYKHMITAVDHDAEALRTLSMRYPSVRVVKANLNEPLPFLWGQFDIGFSNAVIEHLGCQEFFAWEVERVCKKYYVCCPNKLFPFEMHYRLPLFQWLREDHQRWLSSRFALGNFKRGEYEKIRLLTPKKTKKLFLNAKVSLLGLGYNIVAWRG